MKAKAYEDLLLINALSALFMLLVVFVPDSPLRTALGIPLVLFFPGYTLICALFLGKGDLDGVEGLALNIGLSLAVVPLISLALNYTPFSIRLGLTLVSLPLFSLSMSILPACRRRKLPDEARFAPLLSMKMPKWRSMNRAEKLMWAGLIACIFVAGGLTAYFAPMPRVGERFTEFYVPGAGGKIGDYPDEPHA